VRVRRDHEEVQDKKNGQEPEQDAREGGGQHWTPLW
jgi:hypothetical protein